MSMMLAAAFVSCGSDKKDEPSQEPTQPTTPVNPLVGTWSRTIRYTEEDYDKYILVFNENNSGYIKNEWSTRGTSTRQMNFDWSLNTSSSGKYLLSVIYKSGDREIDGPFEGGYAQYNCYVTIAGNTLSIEIGDGTVMIFHR